MFSSVRQSAEGIERLCIECGLFTEFVWVLENPGILLSFSRTGISWKRIHGPGKSWKSIEVDFGKIRV